MKVFSLVVAIVMANYVFAQHHIIPAPSSYLASSGNFIPNEKTIILVDGPCIDEANLLADLLKSQTGKNFLVDDGTLNPVNNYILLQCQEKAKSIPDLPGDIEKRINTKPAGAYQMKIFPDRIILSAKDREGIFYGIMTIKQIILNPTNLKKPHQDIGLPCAAIRDEPVFPHRGLLLDCCRHFMSKEFILKYVDLLALYKMNVFHWHLTEDQGWRIQIDKYPLLTEVGAWRREGDGTTYGGFYTKSDIREIVAYAQSRHITVIPEIEMPGHSLAAIAAYPTLGCTGEQVHVENNWGVFKDIYCAGDEESFVFLTDVLAEVCDLFPSPFIHIGGDEAPKFRWEQCERCQRRIKELGLANEAELQTYFIERIAAFLATKGKKIIGWDEILEGGIPADAVIQSWRGMEGGMRAALEGHGVVMSPTSHCYFDYGLESTDLREVYEFDPVPAGLTALQQTNILGGECNMWTEHAPQELVDGKVFPRMLAISEVLWTYPQDRNYDEFYNRVKNHFDILDDLGVQYGFPVVPVNVIQNHSGQEAIQVKVKGAFEGVEVRAAVFPAIGEIPQSDLVALSTVDSFTINSPSQLVVKASFRGKEYPGLIRRYYSPHSAMAGKVELAEPFSPYYPAGGSNALADGFLGSDNFRDGFWQGLSGKEMKVTVDMGRTIDVTTISSRFFHYGNAWIFRPNLVIFEISRDGVEWKNVGTVHTNSDEKSSGEFVVPYELKVSPQKARFIRMTAKNYGLNPDWHDAPGEPTWLFCDELVVK